jgi:transposase-like protein
MADPTFFEVLHWSEEQCRDYLEQQRWPNGPICPKCGTGNPYRIERKTATKNKVRKLFKCRDKECRKQFTVTVGSIFEDSKIPLNKWFAAIHQMCSSKKGVSAHQIHRELGVDLKSAWFMCHRIREAMRDKELTPLVGTVEADETYVGARTRRGHKIWHERRQDEIELGIRKPGPKGPPLAGKQVVFGIRERGGRLRSIHVADNKGTTLQPLLMAHTDKTVRLITDTAPAYRSVRRHRHHEMINHEIEYVNGDVHTQGIEGAWSILKRGVYGTFQHVGEGYLQNYLHEFDYRYNSRKASDAVRFGALLKQVQGRVTWFCQTSQPENPYA